MAEKLSVTIEWDAEDGLAFTSKQAGNVTPMQAYVAFHFLAMQAEGAVIMQMARSQAVSSPNITIPNVGVPGRRA